jgi:beta-phosphoglucomutase-like phosphatase (HAD superfamily)
MGVATALNRTNCFNALRKNGILELFDAVITLEDTGKNTDKSSPDIFLKVLDYINAMGNNVAPGGALVFDDVPSACRGARSGSFKTCAVYDDIGCGKDNWNLFASSCDYSISKW